MKFLPSLIAAALACSAAAQSTPAPPSDAAKEALEAVFDQNLDPAGFSQALKDASAAGVPQQILVEAQVIRHVFYEPSTKNAEASISTLESLLNLESAYSAEISPVFGSKDEARAIVHYGRAVAAYESGDIETLRTNVTEAFWLHPEQSQLFGQLVSRHREKLRMESLRVDLERPLTDHEGNPTTLKAQLGDNKALLLDFWASWCGPCIQLMPDLKKKADYLKGFDVVVAGMNTDQADGTSHAQRLRDEHGFETPWLCDSRTAPIQDELGIDSIPRMVLIDPEGKLLFNGHPSDPTLWTALRKVAGDLQPVH